MTAIHQQSARDQLTPSWGMLDTLCVSWDVLPEAPGVRELFAEAPALGSARVVVRFVRERVGLQLQGLAKGNVVAERTLGSEILTPGVVELAVGTSVDGVRVVHIDVPGVVRATIALNAQGEPALMYARTPLLGSARFPGGSYDRPTIGWDRSAALVRLS